LFANVDSFLHAALCFSHGISSDKTLIRFSLCCKTSMQTYCGQTVAAGNSPETVFFALEASNVLRQLFHNCHSFQCCHQTFKINL